MRSNPQQVLARLAALSAACQEADRQLSVAARQIAEHQRRRARVLAHYLQPGQDEALEEPYLESLREKQLAQRLS